MYKEHYKSLKTDALDFCNEIRKKYGLRPLITLRAGRLKKASCCPVSNTISYGSVLNVSTCKGAVEINETDHFTSEAVFKFVELFDQGAFPELIRK